MARPAKKVVIASSEELRLSLRSYVINTHHYDAFTATTPAEVTYLLGTLPMDVLLIEMPLDGVTDEALAEWHKISPDTRVLVLTGDLEAGLLGNADVLLTKAQSTAAEVLWRLKLLCGRKRGPKKRSAAELMAA